MAATTQLAEAKEVWIFEMAWLTPSPFPWRGPSLSSASHKHEVEDGLNIGVPWVRETTFPTMDWQRPR